MCSNFKLLLTGIPLLSGNMILAQESPNIILIMADDLGWGDVGFNGNTTIKTPHLDSLASEGIIFDRFYSACAVSSPTRASVLTGRNPFRTGIFHANVGILRPEEVTLPELLLQKGYITGHFGKWHLGTLTYKEKDANRGREGNTKEYNPPIEHGYTEAFVTESKVPTYDPMRKPIKNDGRFWDCLQPEEESLPYGTSYWTISGKKVTDNISGDDSKIIMDRSITFIEHCQEAGRPFFNVLWFHTPHLPCVAGPEYAAMYASHNKKERNYYGCITAMDEQIGRLVSFLKEQGLYDNTIICFCSDNGPEIGTPGSTANLRGRKRDLYEGGIRVPAFMVWPSQIKGGMRTSKIAITSDYLPTFSEILSLQSAPYQLDGESLLPLLKGQEGRKNPLIFLFQNQGVVMEQEHKLIYRNGVYELYNIIDDPLEKNNLAPYYMSEVNRMKIILDDAVSGYHNSFIGKEYGTTSVERMKQRWQDIKVKK